MERVFVVIKNMKRAVRRHHVDRLRKVRSRYNHAGIDRFAYASNPVRAFSEKEFSRRLGMLIHTATLCSCGMCGNPRKSKLNKKSYYLTIQEKKANELFKQELKNYLPAC